MELEMIFEKANDALFLVENRTCIKENNAAVQLKKQFLFPLIKILEIANGIGCMLHSTMDKCLDCEVKSDWDQTAFPLVLVKKDGSKEQFSGSYTAISNKSGLLSIRRIAIQDRLQQVIQNKRLIEYVNQAHENERKALSQELHDGLAQSIYSLMLETRQLNWSDNATNLTEQLKKMDEDFVDLLREVKQLALDLRPTALDDLGLIPAIEALINRLIGSTGLVIHFIPMIQNKRYGSKMETITYRVLQESLMNSIKHAGIEEVWVTLREHKYFLVLDVRDHGKGFDLHEIEKNSQGLGLLHMQERAESIGGQLTIKSKENEGTTVTLQLPIEEEVSL